jgi:hypothetical protein
MYLTVKQQIKHLSKEDYRTLRELCHTAKNLANEAIFFSGSAYDVKISLGDPDTYVTEVTFDRAFGGIDWIIHIVQ